MESKYHFIFMLEKILTKIKKNIPFRLFLAAQPIYHYLLALSAALWYRFPSKKIFVLAVTGTKGKTTTIEIVNAILEDAGYKTALSSTLRFKIDKQEERNLKKMTSPGRFFLQSFLRNAVNKKCDYAIIEMTSEGAGQFRHKFINFDALIFTNLSPEHIESHGSYEKYRDAKLKIAISLKHSSKKEKIVVANKDDKEGGKFLNINVSRKIGYSIEDARPFELTKENLKMTWKGETINSHLSGEFNIYNILAAASFTDTQNIGVKLVKQAVEKFHGVPGRMEKIDAGQDFTVIVDYAHTPDSLEKVYETFYGSQKICVLGAAGGGRDKWKRPELGKIADRHCSKIILTNEDPYDEPPEQIIHDITKGITQSEYIVEMNRQKAIATALSFAKTGDAVIITGKGTDPFIMEQNGEKKEWSEAGVVRNELQKILGLKE